MIPVLIVVTLKSHWQALALTTLMVVWMILLIRSLTSQRAFARRGLRRSESILIAGSVPLLVIWLFVFDAGGLFGLSRAEQVPSASTGASGSCASIDLGMKESTVRAKLGEPSHVHSEEATRGPGAKRWTYNSSRCSIYLMDGEVEFVE